MPETPRPADSQLAPVPVGQTVANGKQPSKEVVREPLARLNATPVSVAKSTVPVIDCLCRAFILVIVGSHGRETQRVESKSASCVLTLIPLVVGVVCEHDEPRLS